MSSIAPPYVVIGAATAATDVDAIQASLFFWSYGATKHTKMRQRSSGRYAVRRK